MNTPTESSNFTEYSVGTKFFKFSVIPIEFNNLGIWNMEYLDCIQLYTVIHV